MKNKIFILLFLTFSLHAYSAEFPYQGSWKRVEVRCLKANGQISRRQELELGELDPATVEFTASQFTQVEISKRGGICDIAGVFDVVKAQDPWVLRLKQTMGVQAACIDRWHGNGVNSTFR